MRVSPLVIALLIAGHLDAALPIVAPTPRVSTFATQSAHATPSLDVRATAVPHRVSASNDPFCTYCWDGVENRGGVNPYWATLEVTDNCDEDMGTWEGWCAICEYLPTMPAGGCGNFEWWENGPFTYELDADGWVTDNGCYSMRCQLSKGPPEIAVLQELVDAGDVGAIASLVEESDGSLWLNEERSALQGMRCAGDVVLHLQLTHFMSMQVGHALATY